MYVGTSALSSRTALFLNASREVAGIDRLPEATQLDGEQLVDLPIDRIQNRRVDRALDHDIAFSKVTCAISVDGRTHSSAPAIADCDRGIGPEVRGPGASNITPTIWPKRYQPPRPLKSRALTILSYAARAASPSCFPFRGHHLMVRRLRRQGRHTTIGSRLAREYRRPNSAAPLATVVLLCFNYERYIDEALDGLFAQTYQPLDIIILDDCSSDRSAEIIEARLAQRGNPPNIRFVRNQRNMVHPIPGILGMIKGALRCPGLRR